MPRPAEPLRKGVGRVAASYKIGGGFTASRQRPKAVRQPTRPALRAAAETVSGNSAPAPGNHGSRSRIATPTGRPFRRVVGVAKIVKEVVDARNRADICIGKHLSVQVPPPIVGDLFDPELVRSHVTEEIIVVDGRRGEGRERPERGGWLRLRRLRRHNRKRRFEA